MQQAEADGYDVSAQLVISKSGRSAQSALCLKQDLKELRELQACQTITSL